MTTVRCKTCNGIIASYRGSRTKEWKLSKIRRHYKKNHPERFKQFAKKAVRTKKEKGIIKKSGSIPYAMLKGLVKKYKSEIIKILKEI